MPAEPPPDEWATYARELGVELHRRRIAAGLSQENLAHAAGMTRTHYQQIERGFWKQDQPSNPSVKAIVGLAKALGVAPGELLPPG